MKKDNGWSIFSVCFIEWLQKLYKHLTRVSAPLAIGRSELAVTIEGKCLVEDARGGSHVGQFACISHLEVAVLTAHKAESCDFKKLD